MSSASPAASQGTSSTLSNATVFPAPSTTNVPSGHSSANTAEASSAPIGHARSYSGTMGASGAIGSDSGCDCGPLGAGASEGASTMTLPTSPAGTSGTAASAAASEAAASFSAANETGTGHNNPSTSSAQSKQAALILDATCLIPTIRSRSFTIRETASSQVRAWNFKRSSKQRPQAISR